jgi:hypothetical protein
MKRVNRIGWDEAMIFETESNSRYRKYIGPCGILKQSDQPTQSAVILRPILSSERSSHINKPATV